VTSYNHSLAEWLNRGEVKLYMNKETYEALKILMDKLDRHVIHATYQEEAKKAYGIVGDWIDKVAKEYN